MTIETKYNIGDEVQFENRGRHYKAKIGIIKIEAWRGGQLIRYHINNNGVAVELREECLFSTKEELLKSLQI